MGGQGGGARKRGGGLGGGRWREGWMEGGRAIDREWLVEMRKVLKEARSPHVLNHALILIICRTSGAGVWPGK